MLIVIVFDGFSGTPTQGAEVRNLSKERLVSVADLHILLQTYFEYI